jgi:hypothetical protein
MSDYEQHAQRTPARRTRRLTFQSSGGEVRLVSDEHLDMICPPSVGEPPEAGRHGGFWVELRDDADRLTFFRRLHDPLATSVELYSPDGSIRREFGPPQDTVFEVLVPDDPAATTLVLMGDYQPSPPSKRRPKAAEARPPGGSRELARFDLGAGAGPTPGSAS